MLYSIVSKRCFKVQILFGLTLSDELFLLHSFSKFEASGMYFLQSGNNFPKQNSSFLQPNDLKSSISCLQKNFKENGTPTTLMHTHISNHSIIYFVVCMKFFIHRNFNQMFQSAPKIIHFGLFFIRHLHLDYSSKTVIELTYYKYTMAIRNCGGVGGQLLSFLL